MLYGVWYFLQPYHETNKSPRRVQVSPPARNDPNLSLLPVV